MTEPQQPLDRLSRRYVVLTEGREDIKDHIVLPGAVRLPHDHDTIPVTLNYDHGRIVGAANDFQRAGVLEGLAKVTFNIRFSEASGLTHDDVRGLRTGVYISNVFSYKPVILSYDGWYITDGLIREISFYDDRPPAVRVSDGRWD